MNDWRRDLANVVVAGCLRVCHGTVFARRGVRLKIQEELSAPDRAWGRVSKTISYGGPESQEVHRTAAPARFPPIRHRSLVREVARMQRQKAQLIRAQSLIASYKFSFSQHEFLTSYDLE